MSWTIKFRIHYCDYLIWAREAYIYGFLCGKIKAVFFGSLFSSSKFMFIGNGTIATHTNGKVLLCKTTLSFFGAKTYRDCVFSLDIVAVAVFKTKVCFTNMPVALPTICSILLVRKWCWLFWNLCYSGVWAVADKVEKIINHIWKSTSRYERKFWATIHVCKLLW